MSQHVIRDVVRRDWIKEQHHLDYDASYRVKPAARSRKSKPYYNETLIGRVKVMPRTRFNKPRKLSYLLAKLDVVPEKAEIYLDRLEYTENLNLDFYQKIESINYNERTITHEK